MRDQGVQYINIKPENCVVDDDNKLILIDFAPHNYYKIHARAPEVHYRNEASIHSLHGLRCEFSPSAFRSHGFGTFAPVRWPKEAHEKANVFALGGVFGMICESEKRCPMPERKWRAYPDESPYDSADRLATPANFRPHCAYDTSFTPTSANLLPQWKDFIQRCLHTDPLKRPSLEEIAMYFEKELAEYTADRLTHTKPPTLEEDLRPKELERSVE